MQKLNDSLKWQCIFDTNPSPIVIYCHCVHIRRIHKQNCKVVSVVVFLKQYLKHHFLVINENTISTNACFCVECMYVLLICTCNVLSMVSGYASHKHVAGHVYGHFDCPVILRGHQVTYALAFPLVSKA